MVLFSLGSRWQQLHGSQLLIKMQIIIMSGVEGAFLLYWNFVFTALCGLL